MPERIFFQCSLPRAGSTLLQNVLAQNPDFYATPTSGIIEIFLNARNIYTNNIEFKAQDVKVVEPAFKALCKGGMNAYFNAITDKKYVIDKSRGWSVTYDFVDWFYPDPKVVVMVRDLRAIVSSMEKKWRQHQHIDSGLQNWNELRNTTVDKRIDYYLMQAPPLAVSMDVLYDTVMRKLSKKCLFIKFENFTNNPQREMERVYEYFNLPHYQHDFNNIEQRTFEDDRLHLPFGEHTVQKVIKPLPLDYYDILGKHNCDNIYNKFQWYFKAFNYDY